MRSVIVQLFALSSLCCATANATIVFNENTDGDLGDYLNPTAISFSGGDNTVVGTIGLPDYHDAMTFTVPDGYALDGFTLDSFGGQGNNQFEYAFYVGADGSGTPSITGSASASDVGTNLLSSLLGAGTYTLLLQQFLPSGQDYQITLGGANLNPQVSHQPEPTALLVWSLIPAFAIAYGWRRRGKKSA